MPSAHRRLPHLVISLCCLLLSGTPLAAAEYFELDLGNLESIQANFPDWLLEVTESGGQLVPGAGWQVEAKQPFGSGRLFLSIESATAPQDLALVFASPSSGKIAVQLYDEDERILAVDLLAHRQSPDDEAIITTLRIPLSEFPSTRHVVLRRLDGPVLVNYLALLALTDPVDQNKAELRHLAAQLGNPLAPENPLLSDLADSLGASQGDALSQLTATSAQPLLELSEQATEAPLSESDLLSILQVLGLQGYDFNAHDFVRAAGEGREEVVRLYLRAGMPIDVRGKTEYTAVAEAATSGELRVLKLLCDAGANLEIRTAGGNSALRMACLNAHLEAVRLLVEHGAELDSIGAYGSTPVKSLYQGRPRNYDMVDATVLYLLEKGANPDIQDEKGETLIHDIAQVGRSDFMRRVTPFSKHLNLADNFGMTPIMYANYRGHSSMEKALIDAGATEWVPSFEDPERELVYSVYRRKHARAKELLEAGTSPNTLDFKGESLLFKTIDQRNLGMLKLLLDHGAQLNVRDRYGRSPLGRVNGAYKESRERIVDYLLISGADPNYADHEDMRDKKPYWTPLMKAADNGNTFRCQRLLEAGADPTERNLPNRTAAIIADRAGHLQLARELREAEENWRTRPSQ